MNVPTPTDPYPFVLNDLDGPFAAIREACDDLLRAINYRWRRRQGMLLGAAGVLILAGLVGLLQGYYLLGFGAVVTGGVGIAWAIASGRSLEIEVETVQLVLVLALLDEFEDSVDAESDGCRLILDLRSVAHNAKFQRGREATFVLDHWFTIDLPLQSGRAVRLSLTEHVHDTGDSRSLGKRMGRDYLVGLYNDHSFDERFLREGVTSHVSAPSGTSVRARVREGLDVFNAAIEQQRVSYRARRSGFLDGLIDVDDAPNDLPALVH